MASSPCSSSAGEGSGPSSARAIIRRYRLGDAAAVGRLIADTYRTHNLGFAPADEQARLLGPFGFAGSPDPAHREAIARAIAAPLVLVAEVDGVLVGVLRGGRRDRPRRAVLQSLFVDGGYHRRGIGRRLVERFEAACRAGGATEIKVAATAYAIPFYQALGYRRSTGMRTTASFEGSGLPYQPMSRSLV